MKHDARVTYFAAGVPGSRRSVGLFKVGQSRDPDGRARSIAARLIGTTSLGELPIRQLLAPFAVPRDELRRRGFESGDGLREWFYDCPAVRELAAWVCEWHPLRDAESASDDADTPNRAANQPDEAAAQECGLQPRAGGVS